MCVTKDTLLFRERLPSFGKNKRKDVTLRQIQLNGTFGARTKRERNNKIRRGTRPGSLFLLRYGPRVDDNAICTHFVLSVAVVSNARLFGIIEHVDVKMNFPPKNFQSKSTQRVYNS